jgi:hypothetical protein
MALPPNLPPYDPTDRIALQQRAQAITLFQANRQGSLDQINRDASKRRRQFYTGVVVTLAGAVCSFAPLFIDMQSNASLFSLGSAFFAFLGVIQSGFGLHGRRNENYRKQDLAIDMERCRRGLAQCTAALENLHQPPRPRVH